MRLKLAIALCIFLFSAVSLFAGSPQPADASSSAANAATSATPQAFVTKRFAASTAQSNVMTTGFVPVFADNAGTLTNSTIFQGSNAVVGINTSNPSATANAKLHINGNLLLMGQNTHQVQLIGAASAGRLGQDLSGFFFASDTAGKSLRFLTTPLGGVLTPIFYVLPTGNVTIGTATGNSKLTVAGTVESTTGGVKFPDGTVQSSALPSGCTTNQIPKWNGTAWTCQADQTAVGTGGGTVTAIMAGNGLTGGTITTTGTLSIDGTKVALLGSSNVFTGSQSTTGDFSANGNVSGNFLNASTAFNLAGFQVLSEAISNQNLFLGIDAGAANNIGGVGDPTSTGSSNTFLGVLTGKFNTDGNYNTFAGSGAGYNNTTGSQNSYFGANAGYANSGNDNTVVGFNAAYSNTGVQNTVAGSQSGYATTSGSGNVFLGYKVGYANTSGSSNTYVGLEAGNQNNGTDNVYLGHDAGADPSITAESNTMRLGNPDNVSNTYMAGVYNVAVSNGIPMVIDSTGHVGASAPSSRRFKDDIRPMGDLTEGLFRLRPVTFYYKRNFDPMTARILQYGLVAEEVAEVYPELVTYDEEGRPSGIKYQYFTPMLLNELQKQHSVIRQQQEVITSQQDQATEQQREIRDLQKRLARMEALLEAQGKN